MLSIGGVLTAGLLLAGPVAPEGPVSLREAAKPGQVTRVVISLKAEGQYRPSGSERKKADSALPLKVEGRFDAWERVVEVETNGNVRRAVRRARQAAAAVSSEPNPFVTSLRPEVAVLVIERREGQPFVFSPGGPLSRPELEVALWPGDPMCLPGLLPANPVAVGDRWDVATDAARSLSSYDALAANALRATLASVDEAKAVVKLSGSIRGALLGAEGTITCEGSFTFDRQAGRISHLELTRQEERKPGQVEQGLEVKSTLTVDRTADEAPPELAESAIARLPQTADPALELLRYTPPRGSYSLLHDRAWHISYDDERQGVLKWLDHGELLAQCNLSLGPNAGKDRHQDPKQFEEDIRRALGKRFEKVLFSGPIDAADDGLFRYRVAVRGQNAEKVEVLWIYYLIANPEGEQLLATFTLAEGTAERFGDQDLRMMASLSWPAPAAPEPKK